MAKYRVVLSDDTLEHMVGPVIIEADSYGTNSNSDQLFLLKDEKPVATFARNEWSAIWNLENGQK